MSTSRQEVLAAFQGARVLVLGADGFIGRWVARLLTEAGATPVLAVLDAERAAGVLERWSIRGEVREVDLRRPGAASELVAAVRPQVLLNLAGYGVARNQRDAKSMWRLNDDLLGELALAFSTERASGWPGVAFVHAGSAAEYGAIGGDLAETSACEPTSDYGLTKLRGTKSLLLRAEIGAFPAVVGRLFTVYGPGEVDGRLLPTLLAARASAGAIPLTAGTQKRDFVYVEESAEGLLRLASVPAERFVAPAVVNVASGTLTSVREFALNAAAVLGIPIARLRFGALPTAADEMEHGPVANARLVELTGWTPRLAVRDGVARTRSFDAAPL